LTTGRVSTAMDAIANASATTIVLFLALVIGQILPQPSV
jgi:hypothetical protein